MDAGGNVHLTGWFSSNAVFGATTLTSRGDRDVFIASYDSSGQLVSLQQGGGLSFDEAVGIGVDATGGYYVAGNTSGDSTFGRTTLGNDARVFVASGGTNFSPPLVIQQPQSLAALAGSDPILASSVRGSAPLSYQWQFYGTNLADATSSSLALSNILVTQGGPYWTVVSNVYGVVTSEVATVTVRAASVLIDRSGGAIQLFWDSTAAWLQRADQVLGPWSLLTNATSPWMVPPTQRSSFYRLQLR